MSKAVCIGLAALLSAGTAQAQNAEETAAFILFGAEDGRTYDDGATHFSIQQVTASPAVYHITVSPSRPTRTEVSVERINDCNYIARWKGNYGKGSGETKIDFSKFVKFNRFDDFSFLQFNGTCAVSTDGKCSDSYGVSKGSQADDARTDAAVAYLKTTFCSGSAF
ncbi:hypothetical protein [Rhizobium sp. 11_C7_N12_5]|uniref:hypothetical protein n=1 Tax=Rhizobium sp. 11_C7_N12_5 TaxID=3240770 RepID=UPI003F24D100